MWRAIFLAEFILLVLLLLAASLVGDKAPPQETGTTSRAQIAEVRQTSVLCGIPVNCVPAKGTVDRGQQVRIVAYTECDRRWYQTDGGGWIEERRIDTGWLDVPYIDAGCGESASTFFQPQDWPVATADLQPTEAAVIEEPVIQDCEGGCTAEPSWCAPAIKGNVSYETGEKIYHVPGQEYYSETRINPSYDERWFCTEDEARAAGWRKSKR